MQWRQIRSFYTVQYITKKPTSSPAPGCLDFLAQALTKVQDSLAIQARNRSIEDEDQFDDDEEHNITRPPPAPVVLRETSDQQLRSSVFELLELKLRASPRAYSDLLRQCRDKKALLEGKHVHAHICMGGFEPDTVLSNLLIQMYGECGSIDEARAVFDSMKNRNEFSYNMISLAYAHNGHLLEAARMFHLAPETNVVSWNIAVAAHAQNGALQQAQFLFDLAPEKNTISWNNMIASLAHARMSSEALRLFMLMDLEGSRPNRVSFLHAIDSCTSAAQGLLLHEELLARVVSFDIAIATQLVIMYGRCGFPDSARNVFDELPHLDVIVWTAMLVAYAQNGQIDEARSVFDRMPGLSVVTWSAMCAAYAHIGKALESLKLFRLMDLEGVQPCKISLIIALDACAISSSLEVGRIIEAFAADFQLQNFLPVRNAVINMYGKCGEIELAEERFESLPRRNSVSWGVMIAAYAQKGQGVKSFETFWRMQLDGMKASEITLCSLLYGAVHSNKFLEGVGFFLSVPEDHGFPRVPEHYFYVGEMLTRSGLLGGSHEEGSTSLPVKDSKSLLAAFTKNNCSRDLQISGL